MKKFRRIYLIGPVKDSTPAFQYSDEVIIVTTGTESFEEIKRRVERELKYFDPKIDAVIATGKSNTILIAGMVLKEKFPEGKINLGIYRGQNVDRKRYDWKVI